MGAARRTARSIEQQSRSEVAQTYNFPEDLRAAQDEFDQLRGDLQRLLKGAALVCRTAARVGHARELVAAGIAS